MAQPGTTQRAFERKVGPVHEPMLWHEGRFKRMTRETAAARVLLYKRITEDREDEFRHSAGALHTIIDFAPGITAAAHGKLTQFAGWKDVFDFPTHRAVSWDLPTLAVGQLWMLGRLGPGELPKGTGKDSVLVEADRMAVFALAALMLTGQLKKMHHASDLLHTLYHPSDATKAELGGIGWADFDRFVDDSERERLMRTAATTIMTYAQEVRTAHRSDSDNFGCLFENLHDFQQQNLYRRSEQSLEDYFQRVPFGSHLISLCKPWKKQKDMTSEDLAQYALDGYCRGLINYSPVTMDGVDVNQARRLRRERDYLQFDFAQNGAGIEGAVRDTYFVAPGVTGSIKAEVHLDLHRLDHDTLLSGLKLDSRIVRQISLVKETMAEIRRETEEELDPADSARDLPYLDYAIQRLEARNIEISGEARQFLARGAADVVSLNARASGDRNDDREMMEIMTSDDRKDDWGVGRRDDPEMAAGNVNMGWHDFEERIGASITKAVRTALSKGDQHVAVLIDKLATTTIEKVLPDEQSIAEICRRIRTAGYYEEGEAVANALEASVRYIHAEPVRLNSPDRDATVGARLVARVSANMHKGAIPALKRGESGALNFGE